MCVCGTWKSERPPPLFLSGNTGFPFFETKINKRKEGEGPIMNLRIPIKRKGKIKTNMMNIIKNSEAEKTAIGVF